MPLGGKGTVDPTVELPAPSAWVLPSDNSSHAGWTDCKDSDVTGSSPPRILIRRGYDPFPSKSLVQEWLGVSGGSGPEGPYSFLVFNLEGML